jgi:hypothetical protein
MIHQFSKPRGLIDDNLTGCLQRYAALGYERIFDTNNNVLQIITRKHNFDSHSTMRETSRGAAACSDRSRPSTPCGTNNFAFDQSNVWWRKDKYSEYDMDGNNG